jgi:hypothetical protein
VYCSPGPLRASNLDTGSEKQYGIWFPEGKHEWYEKDPNTVTEAEFKILKKNVHDLLAPYSEVHFYHNPGRFHSFYAKLIRESNLTNRVKIISHLSDISGNSVRED